MRIWEAQALSWPFPAQQGPSGPRNRMRGTEGRSGREQLVFIFMDVHAWTPLPTPPPAVSPT